MIVLRRLTALVTMLVTLVLVLAESGFACSRDEMAGMRASATVEDTVAANGMAGMPMPPTPVPHPKPCRFPWAPNGCRDMAPCAPAALAVAALMPIPAAPVPDALVTARVTVPPSVETPPEPPPPRA